jgi:6-pyruvoyltetrahydropterin/6-carboxytetrahydropterin synthase
MTTQQPPRQPPQFELSQKFYFEASHTLRRKVDAAGSLRVHGHTYHAEITVRGPVDPATGMLIDLGLLRRAIEAVRGELDHQLLDDVPGIGPATLENLCAFILGRIEPDVPGITAVSVSRQASGDSCVLRKGS